MIRNLDYEKKVIKIIVLLFLIHKAFLTVIPSVSNYCQLQSASVSSQSRDIGNAALKGPRNPLREARNNSLPFWQPVYNPCSRLVAHGH
jgi:hypothetical protein